MFPLAFGGESEALKPMNTHAHRKKGERVAVPCDAHVRWRLIWGLALDLTARCNA